MNLINTDRLYGCPKKAFHKELWVRLLEKQKTVDNVANVFKLSIRQLYKWKESRNNYPLLVLVNLAKSVNMTLKLDYIKTGKDSYVIKNPKITFEESCELVEFFGHLLHDGGIDSRYGVHYTTNSKTKTYSKRFERLVKHCFGEVDVDRRIEKNKITLYYPVVLGYLLADTFKIPKGSKVENNIGVPSFIKNSSKEKMWLYIITSYLCDGIKDKIAITASSKSISDSPQLLNDIKFMLNSLGMRGVVIKKSHIYKTKKDLHRAWILRVLDKQEKIIFRNYLEKYGDFCN